MLTVPRSMDIQIVRGDMDVRRVGLDHLNQANRVRIKGGREGVGREDMDHQTSGQTCVEGGIYRREG